MEPCAVAVVWVSVWFEVGIPVLKPCPPARPPAVPWMMCSLWTALRSALQCDWREEMTCTTVHSLSDHELTPDVSHTTCAKLTLIRRVYKQKKMHRGREELDVQGGAIVMVKQSDPKPNLIMLILQPVACIPSL